MSFIVIMAGSTPKCQIRTNQEDKIGTPNSHGCVLLKNKDVSELFDVVTDKTIVLISLD